MESECKPRVVTLSNVYTVCCFLQDERLGEFVLSTLQRNLARLL